MKFRIEELMDLKGFNNVKLARELGVTRSTITNNLKKPTLETLDRIAKVLDVKISDLIIEDEQETLEPIYKKDEKGKEIVIGFLKKH
ncbi:helix-turn-helix transcriptional regulator [Chryseobacterium sp. SN22]|uniref:helix-turn-helix domain-containing protein n=1 Tax=Chryseobacterium sp. SN22 TaxID=2606431 RepID=UPI0011ED88C6|nr:helix-turn-helix transcriptional regulator [Chryseobacterium sp. SN22]KAA0126476.1 helix-turn-helix transcriptional regulator [Chryseobacterium sp. SN22]